MGRMTTIQLRRWRREENNYITGIVEHSEDDLYDRDDPLSANYIREEETHQNVFFISNTRIYMCAKSEEID